MNYARLLLVVVLGAGLLACQQKNGAPDVLDLLMPIPAGFGISKIQHKSVLVADDRALGGGSEQGMEALRAQGILSSAYFKYWLEDGGAYKVRINVYTDEQALDSSWARRYPPESLGEVTPLSLGDGGFQAEQRILAFRDETALVEIVASKSATRLRDFADRYAAYVARQL